MKLFAVFMRKPERDQINMIVVLADTKKEARTIAADHVLSTSRMHPNDACRWADEWRSPEHAAVFLWSQRAISILKSVRRSSGTIEEVTEGVVGEWE